jgi:hypothetical protein
MKIRKPFISILMTEHEARRLLRLLDGVDRDGARNLGCGEDVRAYDRLARRIRHAKIRFPFSDGGKKVA